jgi:hypothetical protein
MTKANLHALADDYEAEAAKLDGGRDEAPVPNPQPE